MFGVPTEVTETSQSAQPAVDREQLENALAGVNQDLADLYRQAVQILECSERNGAVMVMISHAVREVANNLAYHLGIVEGVRFPPSVDTSTPVGVLAQLWEAEGLRSAHSSLTAGDPGLDELADGRDETIRQSRPIPISEDAYIAIEAVIDAHSKATDSARRRQAFVAVGDSATADNPTAKLLGACFDFFMSYAHLDRTAGGRLPAEAELQDQFAKFEIVVSARLRGFFETVDELADILATANAKASSNDETPENTADAQ
jgi:hypothetical protein